MSSSEKALPQVHLVTPFVLAFVTVRASYECGGKVTLTAEAVPVAAETHCRKEMLLVRSESFPNMNFSWYYLSNEIL
jgi:hypothetical protein